MNFRQKQERRTIFGDVEVFVPFITSHEYDIAAVHPPWCATNGAVSMHFLENFAEGSWFSDLQNEIHAIIEEKSIIKRVALSMYEPKTRWLPIPIFTIKFCSAMKLTVCYIFLAQRELSVYDYGAMINGIFVPEL